MYIWLPSPAFFLFTGGWIGSAKNNPKLTNMGIPLPNREDYQDFSLIRTITPFKTYSTISSLNVECKQHVRNKYLTKLILQTLDPRVIKAPVIIGLDKTAIQ